MELDLFPDGRPVIGLYDERYVPKFLTKLEYGKNIPMLFMKELGDRNHLIMALDLENSEAPFLVTSDRAGNLKEIFGKFGMAEMH